MMKFVPGSLTFFFLALLFSAPAQVERSSDLYKAVLTQDSLLFNVGFNQCDIGQFQNTLSDTFEFYHDKGGITSSKTEFISGIKTGLCAMEDHATRALDSSSVQVFPLKDKGVLYGAIENGIHRFYVTEGNDAPYLTSTSKFTHLWILEHGTFKLQKGLSYDHIDSEKPIDKELLFTDFKETERWLTQLGIPALGIGYIEDGSIKELHVIGELDKDVPAPLNTLWNVASLTKPIVALVTLKLVEQGNWNLDEPIYPYWIDPDVVTDKRHKLLNTRHILSHQSGFSNWRWTDEDLKKLRFHFSPGSHYQYSGEGFEYLKKALENKFHLSIEHLADSLIFQPLNMKDTRFCWDESIDESRFANGFDSNGIPYEHFKRKEASAADDLLTTIEDYTKFIVHMISGAGLSTNLYEEMVSEQVRVNDSKHWGLSWWIDENINSDGDFALVHGGDDLGAHTIAFIVPKTKQGLVIFTNADNGTAAYSEILLHYFGETGQGIINVEMQ